VHRLSRTFGEAGAISGWLRADMYHILPVQTNHGYLYFPVQWVTGSLPGSKAARA
jgi:hypothetical protein